MIIAIDFDGTFDRDPPLWVHFIQMATHVAGHRVVMITGRHKSQPVTGVSGLPIRVLYTAGEPKRLVAESVGLKVDIWIDDEPEKIDPDFDFELEESPN